MMITKLLILVCAEKTEAYSLVYRMKPDWLSPRSKAKASGWLQSAVATKDGLVIQRCH